MRRAWKLVSLRNAVLFLFCAVIIAIFAAVRYRSPNRGLPYHDQFIAGQLKDWQQFGGTWSIEGDTLRNHSDEKGAKLITGSPFWTNYSVEADIQLLGRGDAGIVIRASDIDYGVDSYNGYYAGLRMDDQSLVLGRAEYGWLEFPPVRMPGGISLGHWYHLTVSAYDCAIRASATALDTGDSVTSSAFDPNCARSGKIGLRDVVSGGAWRHVEVHALNDAEGMQLSAGKPTPKSIYPTYQAPYAGIHGLQTEMASDSSQPLTDVVSIDNLRLLAVSRPFHGTVRGTVTLISPHTYIQDATGGAEVVFGEPTVLKLGDEIEVTGDAHREDLSVRIENATKRSIAGVVPIPAFSITPVQAAMGRYDGMFVEVEGRLDSRARAGDRVQLKLSGGQQEFYAISNSRETAASLTELERRSVLRLRGICVVGSAYTQQKVPFALIVRSPDEVEVVSGPPWWTGEHLAVLAAGMLLLGFLIHLLYSHADERRRTAVLNERERLGQEMHDTLAQSFAGLDFKLRAIRNCLLRNGQKIDATRLREELQDACELVRHSHDEARRSLASLRPQVLEKRGLAEALSQVGRQTVAGSSMDFKTEIVGQPRQIPVRIADAFFRIGQEAIANAVQHSHAKHLKLHIDYQNSQLVMVIEDDGLGFRDNRESEGFGLTGMRRRAEGIHAKLSIESNGNGTRITVTAPCKKEPFWLFSLSYIGDQKYE